MIWNPQSENFLAGREQKGQRKNFEMERGMFHVTFSLREPGEEACPKIRKPA